MSKLKKLGSMLLALVFAIGMTCTALAADITINNANAGETYKVYQIFSATVDGDAITYYITEDSAYYGAVAAEGSPFTLVETGTAGTYQVTWSSSTSDDTITAFLVSLGAKEAAYVTQVTATEDGSVTVNDLGAGYYFVTTTTGSAVSVGTTGSAVIADKNTEPTVDKELAEDEDGTAGIGDTVTYTATITGASTVANLVYHDVMSSGLTFDSTSVTVTVGEDTLTADSDYELVTSGMDDDCTFEVKFLKNFTGTIVISYSATVNKDAVIGSTGNSNTGSLSYGDNGTATDKPVVVKVYSFDLKKTDGTNELTGATFILKDADGKEIAVAEDSDGNYRVDATGTATITVGSATIYGLDAGTYYLEETQAPDGYNLLTADVEVVIAGDGTVTVNGKTGTVEVVNEAGSTLPGTGGMGTTIFYIVGGVLAAGAVVLLITKKRMAE